MATSLNASLNVSLNPQSLNASTKQIQQALGRITGQASEFQKSLDASTARVFAFGATTVVINGVTQSFKKLISTTVDVQKRLVEINSIFQATDATFNKFRNSIFQVAKDTGQAFATVADGAAELARQGLSAEETASRLKSALILTRISGLDAEKSVKALTAAINGFASAGLSANQIVNKLVAVDTAFAVSAQDLAEAFSRAGSTAEDAGVSFNELLGLVTAVEQKTARGGAVIGNAFKSIFTRLQRGTTIEQLKGLGVAIDATQSGIQKLNALSNAIENISDPTVVSKIKELAGGVFQINVVSAALKDLSSETSIFRQAALTAASASNEALQKNAALNETIAAQINSLVTGLTSLSEKIGSVTFGPLLEGLIGIATKVTDFLDKALDPDRGNVFIKGLFKTIGSFLSGPAVVIFTAAFIKIFKLVAKFAKDGLGALFQIGTQQERIKSIETGIVALLQKDENLRNVILSSTVSQAQKEQAVLQAIRNENSLLRTQAALMKQIASSAAARGVTGFSSARGFSGKKFAVGGRVSGGSGTKDDVPAMLTAGEFVVQKSSVDKFGTDFMSKINEGRLPFNNGGFVPNFARSFNLTSGKNITLSAARKAVTGAGFKKRKAEGKQTKDDKEIEAGLARLEGGKRKRLIVPANSRFGMFIPKLNRSGNPVLRTISKAKAKPNLTDSTFRIGKVDIPYSLQGAFNIFGPMIPEGVDEAQDPKAEQLERNVKKSIVNEARKFADTLIPATKRGKASKGEISERLGLGANQSKAAGGAKGAVNAAIGAAFEAAVLTGLNINPPKREKGRGDFDIRPVGEKIGKLFLDNKFKSVGIADLKNSDSDGNIKSFIKKLANEKYGSLANMQAALDDPDSNKTTKSKSRKKRVKRNKGGLIPNFTLGRRISDSKIRIHRDTMTGEPLAVTNIEDEPRGLRDAIERERKGMPMAAMGGVIPNYAPAKASGGEGAFNKANNLLFALGSLSLAINTVSADLGNESSLLQESAASREDEIKTSNKLLSEKVREIQSLRDARKAEESATIGLNTLTEAANAAVIALSSVAALNMVTGGGLGRAGSAVSGALSGGGTALGFKLFGKRGAADVNKLNINKGLGSSSRQAMMSRNLAFRNKRGALGDQASNLRQELRTVNAARKAAGRNKLGASEFAARRDTAKQIRAARANNRAEFESAKRARELPKNRARMRVRGLGIATAAFAGIDALNTATDFNLGNITERERNRQFGQQGGGLAGALAGGKIGAGIGTVFGPAGTLIGGLAGGLIGGGIGMFAGGGIGGMFGKDRVKGDTGLGTAQENLLFRRDLKLGGSREEIEKRADTNIRNLRMANRHGEADQLEAAYFSALEQATKVFNDTNASLADQNAALQLFAEASRDAAGMTRNRLPDQLKVDKLIHENGIKLAKARGELARALKAAGARGGLRDFVNKQMRIRTGDGTFLGMGETLDQRVERTSIQSKLKVSSRKEFAGATMLASDQQKMMSELAVLQRAAAEARIDVADMQRSGVTRGPELEALSKAAAEAGEKFKQKALEAGTNLKNKMTDLGDTIAKNESRIKEARETAAINRGNMMDEIVRRGGQDFDRMAGNLQQIDAIRTMERRTPAQTRDMGRMVAMIDKQGTKLQTNELLTAFFMGVKGMTEAAAQDAIEEIRNAQGKFFIKADTAEGRALRDATQEDRDDAAGATIPEATQDLIKETNDLKKQYAITAAQYRKFNDSESTAKFAETLNALQTELNESATTLGGLKTFVTKNINAGAEASKLITESEKFFKSEQTRLKNLQDRVSVLEGERSNLKGG